ncbi:MAG: DUF5020 family protein [Muribaculaceae bacterium]|nr:DUF5020 family protein [Muribaculaceae bacterium]
MKTIIRKMTALAAFCFFAVPVVQSQNFQFHHDFGRNIYPTEEGDRMLTTVTFEMFKPDRWGSTYFFTDFDICRTGVKGAYAELSREFTLGKFKQFAAHIEYDGGLCTDKKSSYGALFQPAMLVGPAWNWANADFSRTFSVQLMYKYFFRGANNDAFSSAQATIVWGLNFGRSAMFTFSGFADLWAEKYYDTVNEKNKHRAVFLTEPQFWFNLKAFKAFEKVNVSVGSECEISNNFIVNTANDKTFFINPTLAAKWTF